MKRILFWIGIMLALIVLVVMARVPESAGQCATGWCPSGGCSSDPITPGEAIGPRQEPAVAVNAAYGYRAVVRTRFRAPDGSAAIGSGVIIDRVDGTAIVLTCAHGYKTRMLVDVVLDDGRAYGANLLGVDAIQDVCLLEITDPGITPIKIEDADPVIGESLYSCGFAEGRRYLGSWGHATTWLSPDEGGSNTFMATSCVTVGGCSGGPIFNRRGRIVGIITGGAFPGGAGNCGPCLPRVRKLIRFLVPPYGRRSATVQRPALAQAAPAEKIDAAPEPETSSTPPMPFPSAESVPPTGGLIESQSPDYAGRIATLGEELRTTGIRLDAVEAGLAEAACEKSVQRRLDALKTDLPREAITAAETVAKTAAAKRVEPIETAVGKLTPIVERIPDLLTRIEAAEGKITQAPGLDRIKAVAREVASGIVAEKGPDLVAAATPVAETITTTVLTAVGVSAPVAGIGAMIAVWLARRGIKKLKARIESRETANSQPPSPGEIVLGPTAAAVKPVIIRQESEPLPQRVETSQTYVPYAASDPQTEALLWAHAELVRRNPGARATVETIEAYAKQYRSGMKSQS